MPFLIALLVIALIIAFLFLSTLFIVPQQQASSTVMPKVSSVLGHTSSNVSASSTRCSSRASTSVSRSWTVSP